MWSITVNNLSSRPLKVRPIIFLFVLFITGITEAQELSKVISVNVRSSIVAVSIDRQGYFYVVLTNGDINKYDTKGEVLYQFSASKNGTPRVIEAWQGLSVFCYYQSFQEYLFLDRFLNNSERFRLPASVGTFSSLMTPSGTNNLWLIDEQGLTLKKIDLQTKNTIIDTPLNLSLQKNRYQFEHIREYQNLLYVSDPGKGLLIFDRFGNFVEQVDLEGVGYFNFLKEELYYLNG